MKGALYFDTSALAKWYLHEPRSQDVEEFIQARGPVDISELTIVEMRCLLARRRREGDINRNTELQVFATFQDEVRLGIIICHPIFEGIAIAALNLLHMVPHVPLRTLDALHLAIAREIQAEILATADRVMIDAAAALGLGVVRFDAARRSR